MAPEINFIRLPGGVTLNYAERGDAAGVPVVFLHGLSDSWRSFAGVLPHLPESIRAIALSMRGHGDSDSHMSDYRPEDFTADLAAFTDALGLEGAIVVGHCMGSAVAQRFAIDHPDRTLGLALVASFLTLRGNPVVTDLWESAVSGLVDPVDPDFVREFQESTLAAPVPPGFLDDVVRESLKVPARVWRSALASFMEADFSGELHKVEAPTLVAWGDRDMLAFRDEQEALAAAIPNSRLVVYAGTGHGLHWERPERFAADLTAFVRGVID